MTEAARGLEEKGEETPWCIQCNQCLKWPGRDECHGCLNAGGKPADTVTFRTVHWDTAVLHAVLRRKVALWEQRHPGWELVPDFARYWEDSTHPSKYVDRDTTIGRKLAWTRLRVVRKHPRGVRWVLPRDLGLWVTANAAFLDAALWATLKEQGVWCPRDTRRSSLMAETIPHDKIDQKPMTVPGEEEEGVSESPGQEQAKAARREHLQEQQPPREEEEPHE